MSTNKIFAKVMGHIYNDFWFICMVVAVYFDSAAFVLMFAFLAIYSKLDDIAKNTATTDDFDFAECDGDCCDSKQKLEVKEEHF